MCREYELRHWMRLLNTSRATLHARLGEHQCSVLPMGAHPNLWDNDSACHDRPQGSQSATEMDFQFDRLCGLDGSVMR